MKALGTFAVARRKWILLATLAFVALAGILGGGVAKKLSSGGFTDPAAESSKSADALSAVFHTGTPNLLLLVTARSSSVDAPDVAAEGTALTAELAASPGVGNVASYWSLGNVPPLRSRDGSQAVVVARITGTDDEVRARIDTISPLFTRHDTAISVQVGGSAEVFRQVAVQVEKDLQKAETLSLPITLLLLVLIFGSVVAAGLPLGVGIVSILGTFLVLRVLAMFTQVSVFSLNLTTAMGLGLAIDYSLFIVSRYREEMRGGLDPRAAVVRSVETAGRTVLFSALTVAVSLAALWVFPLSFLRSFAYTGIAVVALAAAGALLVLPAMLAALGPRVDSLVLFRHKPKPEGTGFWHRLATLVMRRPLVVGMSVVVLLLVLGAPFLKVSFGLADDRVLPAGTSSRQVQDQLRQRFASNELNAMPVVAGSVPDAAGQSQAIASYAAELSALAGVERVDAATGSYAGGSQVAPANPTSARFAATDGTWFSVIPTVEPFSAAGEALVHRLRAAASPFPVQVGGGAAQLVDTKSSLLSRVPLAVGLIAVVTLVALFLMSGGLLVPIKALVLNLLSLSATFGAMVWVFQQGHLSGLLHFTPTGLIDTTTPITMFCIAFGLSMDYEVFLLSRIKEEYDRSGDNTASVALGLERTGRIVTAAAALLAVIFIAFATSQITFIKLLGVGLALAVLMDATLIRGTLVPAFMRLAGRANWWAPAPLRRLHERFGISDAESPPVAAPLTVERVEA